MKKVIVSDRQSLFDIALQEHGNLDGLFGLALLNDKSITDILIVGEVILVNDIETGNDDVVKYLIGRKPTTGIIENT